MSQTRRYPRAALQVEFRGVDSEGVGQLVFETSDLSPGGSFLKSDLLLEQDERLSLEFRVPGIDRLFHVEARVAWVRRFPAPEQSGGMGVEFLTMSDDDRKELTAYLERLPES